MVDLKFDNAILQMVIENSTSSVVITDRDAKIVYVNPKFCDLTGYSEAELMGSNPSLLSSGTHSKEYYDEMWTTINSGEVWQGVFVNKSKKGKVYTENVQIIPIVGDNQDIAYFVGIKDDITRLIDRGNELKAMISIINDLPEEVYLVNPQSMKYLFINAEAQKRLHIAWSKDTNLFIHDLHDQKHEDTMHTIYDKLNSGEIDRKIHYHVQSNLIGDEYPVQETIQLVTYRGRDALLIRTTDVSNLRAIESDLIQSNQQLRNYFEIVSEILLVLNSDAKILQINSSGAEFLGYTKDELLGKSWIEVCIPEFQRNMVRGVFKKVIDGGSGHTHSYENPIITQKGITKIIQWRNTTLIDPKTEEITVLSAGLDITATKAAEEQQELLSELVEQSDDIISLISMDLTYEVVNTTYAEVFEKGKDELIGKSVREIHGPELYALIEPKLLQCREGNIVEFSEWVKLPKLGKRLLQVKYTPMYDKQKRVKGIISLSRDETEKKELEEKRIELSRQLQHSQRLEAIGRMAGGIAHEFNNILQVQSLNLGIIRNMIGEDHELYGSFHQIERARERATNLVRQILTFSKSRHSEVQPTRAQSIISEVVKMISSTSPADVDVTWSINKDIDKISCDPQLLDQIIVNLCNNALFAMKDITDREKILSVNYDYPENTSTTGSQDSENSNSYAELIICDTGVGMDESTMKLIFDPFFTTKPAGEGSGLGLSTVHGMVKDMGGKISFESELDEGTCCKILFPIVREKSQQLASGDSEPTFKKALNILFIDDEEMIRTAAETILSQKGHSIHSCENAEEGLSVIIDDPSRLDLVICDLSLPGMSGVEFVKLLRKERVPIPVIISSGNIEREVEQLINQLASTSYLRKPWNSQQLIKRISQVINGDFEDLKVME